MKCETCSHKEVCKFKEDYEKATAKVKETLGVVSPLSVDVKCEHYASKLVAKVDPTDNYVFRP